jgi:hypothetical protein
MTLDAVGEIANGKYDLVDMMSLKVFDHMLQKRSVHNRDHRLREVAGERTQPQSLASHKDNRFH